MLVGDLICNDDFDCNCEVDVYDCTEDGVQYGDGAEIIWSSIKDGRKLFNGILDMKIEYITLDFDRHSIVIEAAKRR